MHILRCMGLKFCVKFQRAPLKFHTKFWTHTPQNMHFTVFYFCVWVTISLNCDVISLSETSSLDTEIVTSNHIESLSHKKMGLPYAITFFPDTCTFLGQLFPRNRNILIVVKRTRAVKTFACGIWHTRFMLPLLCLIIRSYSRCMFS